MHTASNLLPSIPSTCFLHITLTLAPQVAHTWCLLSGGTDGQLLLWQAESPTESGNQQLSGAAMLAQLVPHMRLAEAALHSSPHWVVGIAAPVQQTDAGVGQGVFVALAQQPLLQVGRHGGRAGWLAPAIGSFPASLLCNHTWPMLQQRQQRKTGHSAWLAEAASDV